MPFARPRQTRSGSSGARAARAVTPVLRQLGVLGDHKVIVRTGGRDAVPDLVERVLVVARLELDLDEAVVVRAVYARAAQHLPERVQVLLHGAAGLVVQVVEG